jgi:hypothetical protein
MDDDKFVDSVCQAQTDILAMIEEHSDDEDNDWIHQIALEEALAVHLWAIHCDKHLADAKTEMFERISESLKDLAAGKYWALEDGIRPS